MAAQNLGSDQEIQAASHHGYQFEKLGRCERSGPHRLRKEKASYVCELTSGGYSNKNAVHTWIVDINRQIILKIFLVPTEVREGAVAGIHKAGFPKSHPRGRSGGTANAEQCTALH